MRDLLTTQYLKMTSELLSPRVPSQKRKRTPETGDGVTSPSKREDTLKKGKEKKGLKVHGG